VNIGSDALAFVVLAVTVCVVFILLGIGAWVWSRAIAEVARAHAHHLSAFEQQEINRVSNRALSEIEERRNELDLPGEHQVATDDELAAVILAKRQQNAFTDRLDRRRTAAQNGSANGGEFESSDDYREYTTEDNEARRPNENDVPLIPKDHLYAPPGESVL
jgi:hypothetical protein